MKKLLALVTVVSVSFIHQEFYAATMVIDSLSGPVTANEVNSFKTYMNSQSPPQTPWGALNGTDGSHNLWADGNGGRQLEAMGMVYEASGDIAVLNKMVSWTDICISQRNDLMSAANGGQRVMWDTNIDMVWCPEEPTSAHAKYAGCENVDVEGHIAYCAKLILQHPSLWNTTVPDGNPKGYGVTYLDRAKAYLAKCDEANDQYSLKWFIQKNTNLIRGPSLSGWTVFSENVTANNRQMMFDSGFQRLAEAHELLGDNPARVAQYDAIVKASVGECYNGMINFGPYTVNGQPCYKWGYYPTSTSGIETTEIHAEYDMIGLWRAFYRPAYGYKLTPLVPFANTLVNAIYLGNNTFSVNVDGTGGSQSPVYSGWIWTADWNPAVYDTLASASVARGWNSGRADVEAGILFEKNRRYQEFAVAASPGSQTVNAGSSTTFTTTLTPLGGFRGSVAMSISGLPAGATATFSSPNVNLATINAAITNLTLTISTTTTTAAGTYALTIIGTSGAVSHSATVNLTINPVADFSISATPSSQSVVEGNSTTYTVNIGSLNGFNSAVSLSAGGLPSGATAGFNPASVTGAGSSTLTVTTSASTPVGSYTITVTGVSGGLSHSTTVTLNVTAPPDFTLSATPSSQTVQAGSGTSYTGTVGALNGFSGTVSFSISGLPAGATASFSPASVTGSGSSTLTVTTSSSTPVGASTLTITGTSGGLTHSVTVSLNVTAPPDFTVSATPSSQTVAAGSGTSYAATVGALNGFGGTVSFSIGGLPAGATASFNPATVSGAGSSTVTVNTSASTPVGAYTLTITGTSGSLSHSTTVSLSVTAPPDFTLAASPASQTVTAGSGASYTATIGAVNGFAGTVSLSASGLPSGATATFSPSSVTGAGSSTMSVTTSSSTPAGTYTITVTGTSGSLVHNATVTLTVNPVITVTWTTVNDTGSGITYSAGWTYSTNRNFGDYNNDVHYTKTNANWAQFTFTGTGVRYITEANTDEGNVDVYIDGVLQTTVSCNAASRQPQFVAYQNTSLAFGTHTIKIVKSSGTYMLLDAFAYTSSATPSLADADIGAVGIAGSGSVNNGVYTISGSGSDIWTAADQFNYDYQNDSGDVAIVARVVSENGTQGFAKAGVMIRETVATNAVQASVLLTPTNGIAMEVRGTTGASTVNLTGWVKPVTAPTWVKVTRSGSTFTGFYSSDGATWTQLATTNVTMSAGITVGLAVTAHSNAESNTATFDNVGIQ